MGSAATIATLLDIEMLEVVKRVNIAQTYLADWDLPIKSGREVSDDLGGRYLLRYVLNRMVGQYSRGSREQHFVTPTPYAPEDTPSWLALPRANEPRTHVLVLDPRKIDRIAGPRRIRLGKGIEYLLIDGFASDAIVLGWELEIK